MEVLLARVAVIMQRIALQSRWQDHLWRPAEIVDTDLLAPDGAQPHCLRRGEADTRWLFPGFELHLYRDEAEGYYLNLSAPEPCCFIMWRMEEVAGEAVAQPKTLTLSYNEAARLMDGGERVDTLPLAPGLVEALAAFTAEHYHPQPKKKRRHPSFEGGAGVERMAKAEGGPDGR